MRILAIGDIHGWLSALDTLLKLMDVQPEDKIISLGDYIDRGPESKGVIDRLIQLHEKDQLIPLKGNHEVMMLNTYYGKKSSLDWIKHWGQETLASYNPHNLENVKDIPLHHWQFLEYHCLESWELDHHIFTHAHLDAHLPLHQQTDYHLFWQKLCDPQPHISGKTLVCGHTPQKDGLPLHVGHTICIDTWIYGEGWLTGLDLHSGDFWQVNQRGQQRTANIEQLRLYPES